MKTLFTILVLLTAIETASAQVTQEWVARYNGPGNHQDEANSIAVDGSGNVYVSGFSRGTGGDYDYLTIKYNSSGAPDWVARYNSPNNGYDEAHSIAVDGSGNVYVTGKSQGVGTNYDFATIKYNSSGDSVWVVRYNGPANRSDGAHSIAVDGSGNVYVTGYSYRSGTNVDYATMKYNSSGVQQWVARYSDSSGSSVNVAYSIEVDGSGNVYVTGYGTRIGTQNDYVTIKYNSSGDSLWVARFNGTLNADDRAYSVALDGSGNVYVTGYTTGIGTSLDYATIKYDSTGDSVWVARYNGLGNSTDWAQSIAVDASGNAYVTGGSGRGNYDFATIKYNSSGDSVWVARYDGPLNNLDEAYSIAIDNSGNIYVAGSSVGTDQAGDFATIKYSSSGVPQWVARYNGPDNGYDLAYSIAVDGSGNVYVTGFSAVSGADLDCATIKYSQSAGIRQISSIVPEQFSLSQNYPNPFNPTTSIEFSLPERSFVKLKVFDVAGREVAELVNENLQAGKFIYEFSSAAISSGLYVYILETEKFTETKKMIVLK